MEPKKTKKADLEPKKVIYRQIGMIIALAIVFLAFEWKKYDKRELDLVTREVLDVQEEIIPITEQEVKPPPPPAPTQTTVINIVEDDVEIEDEFEFDAEADESTQMQDWTPVDVVEEEVVEEEIFTVVESMPSFPGGETALYSYLQKNVQYPQMARESGIQGRVYVTFVVEKDGKVTDVRVMRGIGGGCDEEAIRVVQSMPKWVAGMQRGKPVRVQFNLPIKFTLQ